MDLKTALKVQFHGGLAMLAECVEKCPDDLWVASMGQSETMGGSNPRSVWRIALHAAFFAQLGIGQTYQDMQPWPEAREPFAEMWRRPESLEPYELPADTEPMSQEEVLEYVRFVDSLVDRTVGALKLDSEDSGFPWYDDMSKLSNVLMNLRHLQGHVGQLSELLMSREIDTSWIGKSEGLTQATA